MYEVLADGKHLYFPDDEEYVIYNAKLTDTLSCASEFEFVMPSCNPMYDSLEERVSMVQILRDGEEIFYGEVREVEENINKEKSVYCVDEFAFLYDSVQPQARFQNITPAQLFIEMLNVHNAKVEPKKRFQAGIVTVVDMNDSLYRYTNGEDTLTAIRKKLCEPLNGYLRKRKAGGVTYLDLVKISDYGVSASQPIQFGRNLLKYNSKRSGTEIATVCVPRGARLETQEVEGLDAYVSISSVNDGKNYVVNQKALEHYGWIEKLVKWDNVTDPSNLKRKAQEWVDNNQYKILSLELKAVDLAELNANLEPYKVGDMIQAIAEPFGMNTWFPLAKKVTNINDSITNDVTLSYDVKLSYTQNQNVKFENVEQAIPQSTEILQSAKNNASELIKNAAEGNIFTVYDENGKPKELLIMDTNDINTAQKVWRWNINGLGYSSNGYNGQYGIAMTMDGAIVADIITTGTMKFDRIKGGKLLLGGDNNESGQFILKNANGDIIMTMNNNGILMSLEDGSKIVINPEVGFYQLIGSNQRGYHNLFYTTDVTLPAITQGAGYTSINVKLPDEFKGKNLCASVSIKRIASNNVPSTFGVIGSCYASCGANSSENTVSVSGSLTLYDVKNNSWHAANEHLTLTLTVTA